MSTGREAEILADYYAARGRYEKVVQEIERLLDADIDPSVPSDAIYTIKHRLKDEARFLEKLAAATKKVTLENYVDHIDDLLGMRIVCLLLSDVDRVEEFLDSLIDEKKLRSLRPKDKKKTFVLRVDPREEIPDDIDLQYTGYSSIHYLVSLGEGQRLPEELTRIRDELQVRTLLEEAWGEIDHKYRYELARSGIEVPDHLTRGFYSFAAYLQAASLQAEYLCEHSKGAQPAEPETQATVEGVRGEGLLGELSSVLKNVLGFVPTDRTLWYVARRLRESRVDRVALLELELLTNDVLDEFREIYEEVTGSEPFQLEEERDVDLINAVNLALFRRSRGPDAAEAGLRGVLTRRFSRRTAYELVYVDAKGQRRERVRAEATFEPGMIVLDGKDRWRVEAVETVTDPEFDVRVVLTKL
jgi:GTP pyrophosphokinase